jgi:FtsZ-interacting cell division protein ZipA
MGLIIIVLVVAAILIFAIIWTSRKRPSVFPSQGAPRPSPAPPSVPAKQVIARLSAAEMLSRIQALLAKDNQ